VDYVQSTHAWNAVPKQHAVLVNAIANVDTEVTERLALPTLARYVMLMRTAVVVNAFATQDTSVMDTRAGPIPALSAMLMLTARVVNVFATQDTLVMDTHAESTLAQNAVLMQPAVTNNASARKDSKAMVTHAIALSELSEVLSHGAATAYFLSDIEARYTMTVYWNLKLLMVDVPGALPVLTITIWSGEIVLENNMKENGTGNTVDMAT